MKIALIGTAGSSVGLAPYDDPSWTIWPCSPGCMNPVVKRADAWFEIHDLADSSICTPDYIEFLAKLDKPVWTIRPDPRIPKSLAYPKREMVGKYGEYFFTSSLAWMMALAIEQDGVTDIGLWGVDMSHESEYALQRPGCWFFIREAVKAGINITVPHRSDLLMPPGLYGFNQELPMWRKLWHRRAEIEQQMNERAHEYEHHMREMWFARGAKDAAAAQQHEELMNFHRNEFNFARGAIADLDYVLRTWVH